MIGAWDILMLLVGAWGILMLLVGAWGILTEGDLQTDPGETS